MAENMSERTAAIQSAYNKANTRLRNKYLTEFHEMQQEEAIKLGVHDWQPPLSPRDKARKKLAQLRAEFPDLEEE